MADSFNFPRLADKGIHISVPIPDDADFDAAADADPGLPKSFDSTRKLIRATFPKTSNDATGPAFKFMRANVALGAGVQSNRVRDRMEFLDQPVLEECGEAAFSRIFNAMSNPALTDSERKRLEEDLDEAFPDFEQTLEGDHFVLKWTNKSSYAGDNITDDTIVKQTLEFLENAWEGFSSTFGRSPYIPRARTKLEVLFHDIAPYGAASPPDGPIQFDSVSWINRPGIRIATATHELFHKLQYSFGYRLKHSPERPYKWFSEGTASWAEAFFAKRLSRQSKLTALFDESDTNLLYSSYSALPFWIFFDAHHSSGQGRAVSDYFVAYESTGDPQAALEQIASSDGTRRTFANLYTEFVSSRAQMTWNGDSSNHYDKIRGPDNEIIVVREVFDETETAVPFVISLSESVAGFGSDGYLLRFSLPLANRTIEVAATSAEIDDIHLRCFELRDGEVGEFLDGERTNSDVRLKHGVDSRPIDAFLVVVVGFNERTDYKLEVSVG